MKILFAITVLLLFLVPGETAELSLSISHPVNLPLQDTQILYGPTQLPEIDFEQGETIPRSNLKRLNIEAKAFHLLGQFA